MRSIFPSSLLMFVLLLSTAMTCSEVEPQPMDMTDDDDDGTMLETAPGFSLTSDSGSQISLDNYAGKPLVIFFFGNSCPLCISSPPSIESNITQGFSSNDIGIIGIDTWNGNLSSVTNFKNTTGVTFPLLLQGSSVAADYSTTYDRLVVINAAGEIAFRGQSAASGDVGTVVTLLQELLK